MTNIMPRNSLQRRSSPGSRRFLEVWAKIQYITTNLRQPALCVARTDPRTFNGDEIAVSAKHYVTLRIPTAEHPLSQEHCPNMEVFGIVYIPTGSIYSIVLHMRICIGIKNVSTGAL